VPNIAKKDWNYLYLQIVQGMKLANINQTKPNSEHGVKYDVHLLIEGKNAEHLGILASWIVKQGESSKLTSAYVLDKKSQLSADKPKFLYVSESIPETERWSNILKIAENYAFNAFKNHIPMPIQVAYSGRIDVEREGVCGYASIKIADGRTKFAKWLVKARCGKRDYPSGVTIKTNTDSQSYEKNCAFAEAYAYILKLNGIECQISKWID
jgi:hypothetical protein